MWKGDKSLQQNRRDWNDMLKGVLYDIHHAIDDIMLRFGLPET